MRKPFMPEILARIAPKLNAKVILEPEFQFVGQIRFPNGQRSFFWDNKFNLNPISSVKLVQDKAYTTHFLREFGYDVPREQTFMRSSFRPHLERSRGREEAAEFARTIGYPVFVKPCRLSQGDLVAKAIDEGELIRACEEVFERARVAIVQEAIGGHDLRVVVLDGEVISAYERVPLTVEGDGRSTVFALLEKLQDRFVAEGRDTVIPLEDARIARGLERQGLGLSSVIESGRRVVLLDVANLSLGGTCVSLDDRLHPAIGDLACRVAADFGLRFAGVDLIATSTEREPERMVILEINSAPGLDNYAFSGERQVEYVDGLYLKVLRAVERGPCSGE